MVQIDTIPQSLPLSPPLPDVTINITSASFSGSGQNIESTLTSSVSDLRGTLIECADGSVLNESNTVQERQGSY